jgi:hypothetical protein
VLNNYVDYNKMSCGCEGKNSFGKRSNSAANKAMKLHHTQGMSLKEAWKTVKAGRSGKVVHKRSHKSKLARRRSGSRIKVSVRLGRSKSLAKRAMKLHYTKGISLKKAWKIVKGEKKKMKKSRRFGMVAGPGYEGQTSYTNALAPYFGTSEPFVNASNWWYPYTGGAMQSPGMLIK